MQQAVVDLMARELGPEFDPQAVARATRAALSLGRGRASRIDAPKACSPRAVSLYSASNMQAWP